VSLPALALSGIRKRFGSVTALDGVDFQVARGEVHALLGENGAGKSTLMQIAFGLVRPDAGTIAINGVETRIDSPRTARSHGLGMVHQHFTSIPALTVRENLRLSGWVPDRGSDRDPVRAALMEGLSLDGRVEGMAIGAQQRLEVLKGLAPAGVSILLLDEPTAVLVPREVSELLELLRLLAHRGGSVVLITHKLREVFEVADRVTVLRRGEVTHTGPIGGATPALLTEAMVGDGGAVTAQPRPRSSRGAIRVKAGPVEVCSGEILGVAGVEGNGQREFLRSIVGLEAAVNELEVHGETAFIAEDRTEEGLIPTFSLVENLVLGASSDARWSRGPWIRWTNAIARTRELIDEFQIRASGPGAPARSLSGGNQQRLVFARAIEGNPAVLVAENPTRGLDVRATTFVHERLRSLAASGVAVLVYSTDLDEVLALADRVVVWYRGRPAMARPGAGRDEIGAMMLGLE